MMEAALRYEIERAVPDLKGEIYPTNAPESSKKPYLVYYKANSGRVKTLNGYTDKQASSYIFSVMATRYKDMKDLTAQVETVLISLPDTYIGEAGAVYIEDVTIHNIEETYEPNLKMNRGIIDFTFYY